MAVSHVFTSPVADFTGTVTVFDSNGATATTNATVLVRPSNWNSVHNQFMTISGNTSGQSTASGTNLVLQGGNNVTLSVTDQTIIFSASQSQTVQTQSNVQGISAGTQVGRTGDILFADSNGISFGMSGSTRVTASYTVPSTAGLLSNINVSAGTTSNNLSAITFANSNGLAFGLNGSTITGSYTVPTQTNQSIGVYGSSNTTGESSSSTVDARSLTFLGKGGVSVGLSAGQIVISGGAGAFSAGISGGNTSGNTGTVSNQIVFAGGNNVTVSGSTNAGGMSITISGANAGGAQTGISGIVVSNTTYTSGTVSFSNANGISFGSSAGQAITASYTVPTVTNSSWTVSDSATSVTVGRLAFTASNGLTLSLSTSNNGNHTVIGSYTVPTQSNQTGAIYVTAQSTGQSSSSTWDLRTLSFIPDGIISAGWSNGSFRISATQSNQAFSAGAASSTFQTLIFQDSNGLSFSNNAGSIRVSYTRNVASNAIQSVGSATGSGTNTTRFAPDDHVHAGVFSMGVSTGGNTAGDTRVDVGRFVLFGGNNITLSQGTAAGALNTISIVGGAGGGGFTGGMSNIGNTAGTTGTVQSQMLVVGGPNITVSQSINGNSATISISGNAPGAAAENNWVHLLGANTAGNTTVSGSTVGFSGLNMTLSGTNNSQLVLSVPATSSLVGWRDVAVSTDGSTISVGMNMGSYFGNMNGEWPNSTTMQMLQSTSHVQPFVLDSPISFAFLRVPMSLSNAPSSTAATTGNSSWSYGHTRSHNFVLYSRGTGASSMSLQSVASTQLTDQQSMRFSAAAGNSSQFSVTNRATYQMSTGTVGYTYDYSTSVTRLDFHTSQMTAATGLKMMEFPWATSLAGGQYWLMYGVSSSTVSQHTNQGTRWFNIMSNYGISQPNLAFGTIGSATNSSVGPFLGVGSFTTAGGGTTASLNLSVISTSGSHNKMYFQLIRIA